MCAFNCYSCIAISISSDCLFTEHHVASVCVLLVIARRSVHRPCWSLQSSWPRCWLHSSSTGTRSRSLCRGTWSSDGWLGWPCWRSGPSGTSISSVCWPTRSKCVVRLLVAPPSPSMQARLLPARSWMEGQSGSAKLALQIHDKSLMGIYYLHFVPKSSTLSS